MHGLRSSKLAYWLLWLWVIALAASDAGDNSGSSNKRAGKKPRSKEGKEKKPLSEAQLEQRRKAGKARAKSFTKEYQTEAGKARAKAFTSEYQSRAWYAMLAKRGTEHLSQMGKRGWQAALARQTQFYEQGGIANQKRILATFTRQKPPKTKAVKNHEDRADSGVPASSPTSVPESRK